MERDADVGGHLRLRVAAGAVDPRGIAVQRRVAARALEGPEGVDRGRAERVHATRADREVGMAVPDAERSGGAIRMTTQTLPGVAGHRISGGVDRVANRWRYLQQRMDGDQAVLRLGVAVVACPRVEVGSRVLQARVARDLRGMALLAGDEVGGARRVDDERNSWSVRLVPRRRAAAVTVDALEEVPGVAEQALRRRRAPGYPV